MPGMVLFRKLFNLAAKPLTGSAGKAVTVDRTVQPATRRANPAARTARWAAGDDVPMARMAKLATVTAMLVAGAGALPSCSTTRVLADGEYRLEQNVVTVTNNPDFDTEDIAQYIKQVPNTYFIGTWNPFINIYNWSGKEGKSMMSRLVRNVGVAPVVFNENLVHSSVQNIDSHLEYMGWYGSKVESRIETKKRRVIVHYDVTLGERLRIDSLFFTVPETGEFRKDFFQDTSKVTVKAGNWLSEADLEAETARLATEMRNKGYYGFTKNNCSFVADTISMPGTLILEMKVTEHSRKETPENAKPIRKYSFGDVTISHSANLKFRESVLKGMNMVVPGKLYNEQDVDNTYSRLSSLKAFNNVSIELSSKDTSTVDCAITLSESKLQSLKLSLEGSTNSTGLLGFSPQINYTHKNIFHGGEWLTLGFLGNFQFKPNSDTKATEAGVSAALSLPKFLGLPYKAFKGGNIPRTEFKMSFSHQDRPEYTRDMTSFSFGYTGYYKNKIFYQFYPVQANIVNLQSMDPTFYNTLSGNPFLRYAYQDHFDAGLGFNLYRTSCQDAVPHETYSYWRLQGDLSGNLLSSFNGLLNENEEGAKLLLGVPYTQYVRGELTLGKTWFVGKESKNSIATRFQAGAGYAYGNSSALPFEKQFYAGGASSLRGWQVRSVGPGLAPESTSFSIPSQTGDMKLEANIEYRFQLFWRLQGAMFADAGNVWTLMDENNEDKSNFTFKDLPSSIAADWGLGLRLDMTFFLLRLDFGMKVHDPSSANQSWRSPDMWLKKDGYAFHFGVGYPF